MKKAINTIVIIFAIVFIFKTEEELELLPTKRLFFSIKNSLKNPSHEEPSKEQNLFFEIMLNYF